MGGRPRCRLDGIGVVRVPESIRSLCGSYTHIASRVLARQINSIPTLMVIRDKALLFSQPGMLPEKALSTLVEQARKLDMDDVVLRDARPSEQPAASA